MSNKIYSFVALLMATFMMVSCLKDDNDDTVTTYNDTAITSFTLGILKQVRDTVTKAGKDSTYKASYNAAKCKFYIDQAQGLIYNPDSLPYGTDAAHVLATITAKNSGTIVIQSAKDETMTYYSSSDSIDFTTPRTLRVYASSGEGYRSYKVSVNVHKQKGNRFGWAALQANSDFAAFTAMKAVSTGDKVFVFGTDGTQTTGYMTATTDGNSWTKLSKTFTDNAYKSILAQGGKLYAADNGQILTSADGNTWTLTGTNADIAQLVAASASELFALTADGNLIASKDNGTTWTDETLDSDAALLPASHINYTLAATTGSKSISTVMIVGNTADGKSNVAWTKLSDSNRPSTAHTWNYVESAASKYGLPLYGNLTVVNYDNASLAIGTADSNGFGPMLLSRDGGITWKTDGSFTYPENALPAATLTAAVDSEQYVWLFSGSSIWRGRLNRIAWEQNLNKAAE
ncbi:MAG: DUF6242 domain-containing protein [Prevotella sp.]|nr:DUF6242 domain-containing protein [Prevotella sp.]